MGSDLALINLLIRLSLVSGPQYNISPCLPIGTAFPVFGYTASDVQLNAARLQVTSCTFRVQPTPQSPIPGTPPTSCSPNCDRWPLLPSWLRRALP